MSEFISEQLDEPSQELKDLFLGSCLRYVELGLGHLVLEDGHIIDVNKDSETEVGFSLGEEVNDGSGEPNILWTDIIRCSDGQLIKNMEPSRSPRTPQEDSKVKPSREALAEQTIDHLLAPEGYSATQKILRVIDAQNEAEKLGLLTVNAFDLQEAVDLMQAEIRRNS